VCTAGGQDTTPGQFEKNSYYFIQTEGVEVEGYLLPLSLVRCLNASDEGRIARVEYQHGTAYDGWWRTWLPAGVPGNKVYTENGIPYESVVLTDVLRGAGSTSRGKAVYSNKYKLAKKTLARLSELEEARFSLFLQVNSTEPDVLNRTKQALAEPSRDGLVDPVPENNGTDSEDGSDVHKSSESEAGTVDGEDSDASAANDSGSSSSSSDSSPERTTRGGCSPSPRKTPPKRGKPAAKNSTKPRAELHSKTQHNDRRRKAKDGVTRSVQDISYRANPADRTTRRNTRQSAGQSGSKREAIVNGMLE
jgi:hypothetical protein